MLRLAGDSDLSNRLALHFLVADLRNDCTALGPPTVIDVSALRLAVRTTIELMIEYARTVPGGLTVHCSPQLRFMLDSSGGAAVPNPRHGGNLTRRAGTLPAGA
ncbi:hypothetical protein ABZS66_55420 [Dactylosporangium sp. NPDC005572]|uniref:hypothetical protein n=1 Tax=Dactylosporangium sp. NPDC005572 TaxID=3156889 RepID=UPI00339F78ED